MKKKILGACVTIAVFTIVSLLQVQGRAQDATGQPDPFGISMGRRIGVVSLGMKKEEILKRIPLLAKTYQHSHGVGELVYIYKTTHQDRAIFSILIMNDRVVQIATTDRRYKLDNRSLFADIREIKLFLTSYKGNLEKTNYFFPLATGKKRMEFHDDVKNGIAFVIIPSVPDSVKEIVTPALEDLGFGSFSRPEVHLTDYVIVHNPGRSVIGILNGVRGSTTPPRPKSVSKPVEIALTPTQRNKAHNALQALRSVESVASIGTYLTFTNQLSTAKITIDDSLRSLPKSPLKTAIERAMNSYTSAQSSWRDHIRSNNSVSATMAINAMDAASARIREIEVLLRKR